MACMVVVAPGSSVCNLAEAFVRNLFFSIGRPVGANGEGLGGKERSECDDCDDGGRAGELSTGAQSASEPPPPS